MAQKRNGVTVMRRLWVRSPLEGMNYYLIIFSFLRFATKANVQNCQCLENFSEKLGTECLNTKFPLPPMPTGYSVKLIIFNITFLG